MPSAQHTVREELYGVVLFVAAVWAAFLVSLVFPSIDSYGVAPRTLIGLAGIPAAPFLHAGWGHLLANTVPLAVLLALLAGSQARSWEIVGDVVLLGGLLLWIVGRPAIHIGASGLIFGLITYLIAAGIFERRTVPLIIAVVVGFLYGGTLLSGIVPHFGSHISWEGHLCSAVAGAIVAYALTRKADNPGRLAGR